MILLLGKIFIVAALAGGTPPESDLDSALSRYAKSNSVKAEIQKTIRLSLLKRDTTSNGTLVLKKGGFLKLEIEDPQRQKLIVTPKNVWAVDFPPTGVDDKIRVTHLKRAQKGKSDILIFSLLSDGKMMRQFIQKSKETKGEIETYTLVSKSELEDVSKLQVVVNRESSEIAEIRWWDSLENETSFVLKNTKFGTKVSKDEFKYSPPKGAEVTEL